MKVLVIGSGGREHALAYTAAGTTCNKRGYGYRGS